MKRLGVRWPPRAVCGQSGGRAGKNRTNAAPPAVKYGANHAAVGQSFTHDGVTLYYEVYGAGEPLLLVSGNGGSIADLARRSRHFRRRYKVIVMDGRDQGKSADIPASSPTRR